MTDSNLTSLKDLKQRRPPNPERVAAIKHAMTLDIALHELRDRAGVSQTALAERLATSRPNVSRIERETDIRLSTLERYVKALGGELVIDVMLGDKRIPLVAAERP